jgi:hypothetical protein
MSMTDISKFRFSETFNNSDGKTSGSGFIGVITGLVGAFLLFAGVFAFFFKYPDSILFLSTGLKVVGLSAGLLGLRKVGGQLVESFSKNKTQEPVIDERG